MAFVQKKKIGEKENGSFEENAHRDPVDLYFALSNIKQKLSGF